MRKMVLALLVGGLALTGCEKANTPEVTPETPAQDAPLSQPAAPPPVSATPAPEPPKAAAASTPRPLAPEGIYFLRAAQRIETDAGIIGIKRGQQLTKTGEGKYTTTTNEVLTLSEGMVTNDLEEVRQILGSEQQALAKLAEWNQKQAQARTSQQVQATATPAAQPITRAATMAPQARTRITPPASSLSTGSTGARGGGLGSTHSNNRSKKYQDANGQWYWKDIRGQRHYD